MHGVVVRDREEVVPRGVLLLTSCAQSGDRQRPSVREARDLALPLVLERCRTDNQRALDAKLARPDLGRRERLDGLAQPHLIGNQAAAGACREERAFALVLVELTLEQRAEVRVTDTSRKGFSDTPLAA